jgi:nitronate monooxygenase
MDRSLVTEAQALVRLALDAGLKLFPFRGRQLLPIVQGGMGVAISAGGLAGTVASYGGVGTISSVDLRRRYPDLMERTGHLTGEAAKAQINEANLVALDREIRRARTIAQGRGVVAVNVMRAVDQYEGYVKQSLESGIDAVVVGAGLPLDLPDLAKDHPNVALIPILSDARGVQVVVKRWEKKGRLPDAIVIEHPAKAGGHLGAAKVADVNDRRFDFDVVLPEVLQFLRSIGLEGRIPLIPAGGIEKQADIRQLQAMGAAAVQLGTAFAVTEECDADIAFKQVLAKAKPEDIVEFTSVAGLPARAVRTPWLEKYMKLEPKLQEHAHQKTHCTLWFDCLAHCGLRDGNKNWGQFCIDKVLAYAASGNVKQGLFFRGAGRLPFGDQIRPVEDLLKWLLGNVVADTTDQPGLALAAT